MKLPELIEALQKIQADTGSHPKLDGEIEVETGDEDFIIEKVEPVTLGGCGCWIGARLVLKRYTDIH